MRAITPVAEDYRNAEQEYEDVCKLKTRAVYLIVFQEGRVMRNKLTKICESFMARMVDLPTQMGA